MTILRRFTDFVLQSRLQAMGVAFVLAYIPLLGSIGILIAALVTLRKGAYDGALVVLSATVPYVLRYFAGNTVAGSEGFELFSLYIIVVSNILVWVFAVLLRRYQNWNLILEYGLLVGLIFIGLLHILVPDLQNWWASKLTQLFNKSNMLSDLSNQDLAKNKEIQARMVASAKLYATGFLATSVSLNALLQLFIARWWQAYIFNPGGLREELHNIRLSHVVSVIFIACVLLALLKNETVIDMMPLAYALFAIAGLSLLHFYLAKTKLGWLWISLVYVLFVLLFPDSLIFLAMIAVLDSWLNIRKRWLKQ